MIKMFENIDLNKLDKSIRKLFPVIYEFEFNGLILLFGGSIKDIIMNKPIKDLDFVLLTTKDGEIERFIDKYDLKFKKNIYKGYKIKYNGLDIDLTCTDDLYDAGHLSTDFLFYDIKRKILIPMGIKNTIRKNVVIEYYYQSYFRTKVRVKKAKKFVEFLSEDKKRVKIKRRYNRVYELIKSFFRHPSKILKFLDK